MKPFFTKLLAILGFCGASFLIGRFSSPKQPAKVQVVYQDRIKYVIQKQQAITKHVVQVIEKRVDGSQKVTTETTQQATTATVTHETETSKEKSLIINHDLQWRVSAKVGFQLGSLNQPYYGVDISRRIIGPFFLDAGVLVRPLEISRPIMLLGISGEF